MVMIDTAEGNGGLPSREERRQLGETARARVPHAVHASWAPAPDRDDPIAQLEEQARTRLSDLVPLRNARMAISPLTFYRGAALPMATDLAATPASGLIVQACGDAHLSNFGLFASPERELVFDLNDFDETAPGPWEWDVKRLAGSLVVAARILGAHAHDTRHAAIHALRSYQEHVADYAAMRAIDVYYARVDASTIMAGAAKGERAFVASTVESASHHDALHALPHLTEIGPDGHRRIADHPPLTIHHPELDAADIRSRAMAEYAQSLQEDRRALLDRYAIVDAAMKVVGVGSVGLRAAVCLLDGGDGDDPLFLQLKQAEASVLERARSRSVPGHHGKRVVAGQRRLQAVSDVLLGWTSGPHGGQFYVRQLQDQKAGAVIEAMTLDDLLTWGRLCGWALARGHARSGDPVAIAAYLGSGDSFAHAIAEFATSYADQTERDHAALVAAIRAGRMATADHP